PADGAHVPGRRVSSDVHELAPSAEPRGDDGAIIVGAFKLLVFAGPRRPRPRWPLRRYPVPAFEARPVRSNANCRRHYGWHSEGLGALDEATFVAASLANDLTSSTPTAGR